jgi:mannose-6-phosphate isomerase-like protein (cupin superfamily)
MVYFERMKTVVFAVILALPLAAREPLAQRIVHTDAAKYQAVKGVHLGAGELRYMPLFDSHSLDTNLYFLHRGALQPKSSLGNHFHNNCEEMYIIFDGEAQFTVDGRTSVLKGPAGAPCRVGHSHALYNHTDKPVEFMNINVSMLKGENDAFNTNDPRVDVPLDPIPVFMSISLDRTLLQAVNNMTGGKGAAAYRRVIGPSVFSGPWAYVDHLVLSAGASVGAQVHRGVAEFYYVMSGAGTATVAGETAPIRVGDAVPVQLNDVHSFANPGTEPLEFLIVGVSRERNKEVARNRFQPRLTLPLAEWFRLPAGL